LQAWPAQHSVSVWHAPSWLQLAPLPPLVLPVAELATGKAHPPGVQSSPAQQSAAVAQDSPARPQKKPASFRVSGLVWQPATTTTTASALIPPLMRGPPCRSAVDA
jgi:hypothetical protein